MENNAAKKSSRRLSTVHLALCALFTALVAAGAFIQIPVPFMDYFTLQFFFVVLALMLLGPRLVALSVAVYVALGLIGVPIFAAGGGIGYVLRPSFGYLLGFIAAAFVTGALCRRMRKSTWFSFFLAALGGFAVTYAMGIAYKYVILNFVLDTPASLWVILLSCFPLDMPGDLLLCAAAALAGRRMDRAKIARYPG